MKLRNKITGEIGKILKQLSEDNQIEVITDNKLYVVKSLTELNEGWEDYEEPKEHRCITMYGGITRIRDDEEPIDDLKEIGNYFNDKESAYDALDKLKAWKRLKDKGFKLNAVVDDTFFCLDIYISGKEYEKIKDDLKILFGDEE